MTNLTETEQERPAKRRDVTRDKLIEAAYAVFAENGVQASSVEAICEAAGFTRGAFYSNFSSKDELLVALLEREQNEAVLQVGEVMDRVFTGESAGQDPLVTLMSVVDGVFAGKTDLRTGFMLRTEFRLNALRDPALAGSLAASETRFFQDLGRVITALVQRAGLRMRIEPEDAGRLICAAFEGAVLEAALSCTAGPGSIKVLSENFRTRVLPALVTGLTEPLEQ